MSPKEQSEAAKLLSEWMELVKYQGDDEATRLELLGRFLHLVDRTDAFLTLSGPESHGQRRRS